MDVPTASASPSLCVPPVGEHMSSPHVLLPNISSSSKNKIESDGSGSSLLDYGNNQLAIASS